MKDFFNKYATIVLVYVKFFKISYKHIIANN